MWPGVRPPALGAHARPSIPCQALCQSRPTRSFRAYADGVRRSIANRSLEVLPIYLQLLAGKDDATHRTVAWTACLYALLLCFFFIFGTLILRLFGVSPPMVRIVGGIIQM